MTLSVWLVAKPSEPASVKKAGSFAPRIQTRGDGRKPGTHRPSQARYRISAIENDPSFRGVVGLDRCPYL